MQLHIPQLLPSYSLLVLAVQALAFMGIYLLVRFTGKGNKAGR